MGNRDAPIIFGAPHAIPLNERFIARGKRYGDHYVHHLVYYALHEIGGMPVFAFSADCDPNKSEAYNIDRYGRYDPAYYNRVMGLVEHVRERGVRFMPESYPEHYGMYIEIHVAGQPGINSKDLWIHHDIEVTTGNREYQDFAKMVAGFIPGDVSADWDGIFYKGAGNGKPSYNRVLRDCWSAGVPAVMVEISPRIVYPGWGRANLLDRLAPGQFAEGAREVMDGLCSLGKALKSDPVSLMLE